MNAQEFMDSLANRLTLKAKCWDIAIKNNVDMVLLGVASNVKHYNCNLVKPLEKELTEEEFDTLKRGLGE